MQLSGHDREGSGIVTLGALKTPSCGNKRTKIAPNPRSFSRHPPADHSTPVTVAPVPPCVHPPATPQTACCPTIFGSSWDQDQCPDDSPPYVRPGASASTHELFSLPLVYLPQISLKCLPLSCPLFFFELNTNADFVLTSFSY